MKESRFTRILYAFIVCQCYYSYVVQALYEDQIGKFDWRLENVGKVTKAVFDESTHYKHIIVSSEENVIASLVTTTGVIAWRHVMEDSSRLIDMFTIKESNHHWLYTVTQSHVRKWHPVNGALIWETPFPSQITNYNYEVTDSSIVLALPKEVKCISLSSGQELWSLDAPYQPASQIIASSVVESSYVADINGSTVTIYLVQDEVIKQHKTVVMPSTELKCKANGDRLACLNLQTTDIYLLTMSDKSTKPEAMKYQPGDPFVSLSFEGNDKLIVRGSKSNVLFKLTNTGVEKILEFEGVGSITKSPEKKDILISVHNSQEKVLEVRGHSIDNGQELAEYRQTVSTSVAAAARLVTPLTYVRPGGSLSYRLLTVFDDFTISLIQQSGSTLWYREEGLSALACLEMVDLPVSYVDAQMEEEFGAHASDGLFNQFMSRLLTQFQQLSSFLVHSYQKYVTGLRVVMETEDHMALDEDYLTRDEFNLHKMIVGVSKTGKIYGLDSYTGKVVWSRYISSLGPFPSVDRLLLFIQRSTAHFPHNPVATVIGHDKACSEGNSLLYSFNPITGEPYTPKPESLKFKVDQAMMIPISQTDFLKPIVMLDSLKQVHVYPVTADVPGPQEYYLFSAQRETGSFVGLRVSGASLQTLRAEPTWSVNLGDRILSLNTKAWREKVHSLGRVLSDRSILYKYSNPNLVSIIAINSADTEYSSLNVYLLDGVTGRIIFTCEHKRASTPVHMVHSENWVIYTYYNMKNRRVEIAVLELYEGSSQTNATAFSSLESNVNPIVMRQAYILGTSISTLATTQTERGITGKMVLFAKTSGGIIEVPKGLLDPRRPQTPTPASREEGLMPYIPELPQSYEWTINYNQSVYRIQDIHTEPAGLESTSLLVAYGLDVFYTRIAPSKMYDVLKDDFDYAFIGAVTGGMIIASCISRHFALRKMVKRAWK